jgi:hypothetical protein
MTSLPVPEWRAAQGMATDQPAGSWSGSCAQLVWPARLGQDVEMCSRSVLSKTPEFYRSQNEAVRILGSSIMISRGEPYQVVVAVLVAHELGIMRAPGLDVPFAAVTLAHRPGWVRWSAAGVFGLRLAVVQVAWNSSAVHLGYVVHDQSQAFISAPTKRMQLTPL